MREIVGSVLLVLLCAAGLTAVLQSFCTWLLAPGKEKAMLILVPMRGHCEDAEQVLRSAVQRVRAMGGADRKTLRCVDCGMDPATRDVCARMCAAHDGLFLVKIEEISAHIHCNPEENQV